MDVDRQPPSGVVTFVLTDVVGSTKLWDSVPTEMAVALDLHDQVVAAAVERHDGLVLKHRGEGDSALLRVRAAQRCRPGGLRRPARPRCAGVAAGGPDPGAHRRAHRRGGLPGRRLPRHDRQPGGPPPRGGGGRRGAPRAPPWPTSWRTTPAPGRRAGLARTGGAARPGATGGGVRARRPRPGVAERHATRTVGREPPQREAS